VKRGRGEGVKLGSGKGEKGEGVWMWVWVCEGIIPYPLSRVTNHELRFTIYGTKVKDGSEKT